MALLLRCSPDISANGIDPKATIFIRHNGSPNKTSINLKSWFAKQGIAVPFNKLAEEHVRSNDPIRAEADTERRKAETSLVKNLAAGKITAVGLRNGTGDPEEVPTVHWPLLAFWTEILINAAPFHAQS